MGSESSLGQHGMPSSFTLQSGYFMPDLELSGMYALAKCLSSPNVLPVSSWRYKSAESNAASPRKVFGFINGCLVKKSFSVGMSSFASWTHLSSSGEDDFFSTTISGCDVMNSLL